VSISEDVKANATVEILASAEHNKVFVVKESGQDVLACIDSAVHKLERQLRRRKGKERDNKHADII
jgi:ribosomal subunit interface protein